MHYRRVFTLLLALSLLGHLSLHAGSAAAQTPAPANPAKAPLIDINSATAAELTAVPQIGPVRAKAIIAGRPYRGKDDLVSQRIISQGVYEKIRDKIIAKP